MESYWMSLHLCWSKNQELSMIGRLIEEEEATSLGLINHSVARDQVVSKACEIAWSFSEKPSVAWKRTKARFCEIAVAGFDEAFRAGVLGQQEAYAKGEPQAVINAFLGKKN
jgi:enoyl-CoA hydratase/carnithine racemase